MVSGRSERKIGSIFTTSVFILLIKKSTRDISHGKKRREKKEKTCSPGELRDEKVQSHETERANVN